MQGSDLRYLAGVADVARADYKDAAISLWVDGSLHAGYQGSGVAATRAVGEVDRVPADLSVRVSAQRFRQLTGLFAGDGNVQLECTPSLLVIKSSGQRLSLHTYGAAEPITPPQLEQFMRLDVEALAEEVSLASDFVSDANPVFQCLRLVQAASNALGIMACDPSTGGFLSTSIQLAHIGRLGADDVLVYASDLEQGVKLLQTGDMRVGVAGNRLALVSPTASYQCSRMPGSWPSLDKLTAYNDYRPAFMLSTPALKNSSESAKELEAQGIEIRCAMSGVLLVTNTSQEGDHVAMANSQPQQEYSVSFSTKHFLRAARLGNDGVTIQLPNDANQQTKLNAGRRTYWITRLATR